jgi:copper oxidase (laccase) domain-containing protein
MPMHADWLQADWNVPDVASVMSTRAGGTSPAPWDSFNLGIAVNDDPQRVARHRELFQQVLDRYFGGRADAATDERI